MDRTARLWDVATGKQLGPSLRHSDRVVKVDFWPDGKTIVTSESSGESTTSVLTTARYWLLPQPIQETDQEVELWAQTITGLELDEKGGVSVLEPDQWKERHRRLERALDEAE
jgi:WD40 repeat protein